MMGMTIERALEEGDPSRPFRNASSKSSKRQITRNRASYSCQTCRRRKIKCDKQHPICGSCLRNDEACNYGDSPSNTKDRGAESKSTGTKRRWASTPHDLNTAPDVRLFSGTLPFDVSDLDALELQLSRVTAMVETMRRESGTAPRPPGPPTQMSGQDEWQTTHVGRRDAAEEEPPSLSKPLSELNISEADWPSANGPKYHFWSTVVDEIDQLYALMQGVRPTGPPAHADVATVSASYSDASRSPDSHRKNNFRGAEHLSFLQMAHLEDDYKPNLDCQLCNRMSLDKAILLPGIHSAKLSSTLNVDLTAGTPTETQSNVLFRSWLTNIYPAMPTLPLRPIFKQYHAYWEWRRETSPGLDTETETETESPDVYFMPNLCCIWYTGILSLSKKGFQKWFPSRTRAELASFYHDQVIRYLALASFPSNLQLPLLTAFVTLLAIPAAEEEPLESSMYYNIMVKVAQTIGIQREPVVYGMTLHDAEMRRRLWWHIVRLDVSFASLSGYPSFTNADMADVRPVSEVHEMYIGSSQEKEYFERAASKSQNEAVLPEPMSGDTIFSVFQMVAKASHTITLAMRQAINMHLSAKMINKSALQEINRVIGEANDEALETIRRIPTKGFPELAFNPDEKAWSHWPILECDSAVGDAVTEEEFALYYGIRDAPSISSKLAQYHRQKLCVFNKWARINLSLLCDKMHCVAYAPFLKNAKSKVWSTGRQCALHHATSFLRKLISLATDPALEAFRCLWPGLHHPMQAAIIVLIDLHERPRSPEAPRSRALIDKIFSLTDPATGIVGGEHGVSARRPLHECGTEAWDLLRDLRSTGWRKAELDPNVLWTQEDQIAVGIAKPLTNGERMLQSLREDAFLPDIPLGTDLDIETTGETYTGLDYMIKLTVNGFTDTLPPVEAPVKTERSSRRLLRRPGQRLMPFPLSGHETAKCPGGCPGGANPANNDQSFAEADAVRIQELKRVTMKEADSQRSEGLVTDPAQWLQNQSNGTQDRLNSTLPVNGRHEVGDSSSGAKESIALDVSENGTNGSYDTSDLSNGTTAQGSDKSDVFDWERWDAVFGQYSGFTDLMELDEFH